MHYAPRCHTKTALLFRMIADRTIVTYMRFRKDLSINSFLLFYFALRDILNTHQKFKTVCLVGNLKQLCENGDGTQTCTRE